MVLWLVALGRAVLRGQLNRDREPNELSAVVNVNIFDFMFSSGAWSIPARSRADPVVARSIVVVLLMKGGRERKKRDSLCWKICGALRWFFRSFLGIMGRDGL